MIIARAPLRISFAGGGTDMPTFYEKNEFGAVVSTSINRYVYVTLNKKFGGKISVRYRDHEVVDCAEQLKHPLIRETLLNYGVHEGVELVIISDVPARGSGLGASSALAVALCACLEYYTCYENDNSKHDANYLAIRASKIEIELVGSPIGKQDHYASALGGMNYFTFHGEGTVSVDSCLRSEFTEELEEQSMLFYLNMEHDYKDSHFVQRVLKDQVADMKLDKKTKTYLLQRDNAVELWNDLQYENIERFMDHVNENWRLKRTLHSEISNLKIDQCIAQAYKGGATAAKVCGAGGGGFLYLMVTPDMHESVRKELKDLHELDFKFEENGVEVIFSDHERNHAECNR